MRILFRPFHPVLLLALAAGAAVGLLGGCAGHPRKAPSYDRSIDDEDHDPTYREDPQRAGEETRDE